MAIVPSDSFFYEVRSDACKDIFRDNVLYNFKNKISTPLLLNGKWEVALVQVTYPMCWRNIQKTFVYRCKTRFTPEPGTTFEETVDIDLVIPAGYYNSIQEIGDYICNDWFNKMAAYEKEGKTRRWAKIFRFDGKTNRCCFTARFCSVTFAVDQTRTADDLFERLGFETNDKSSISTAVKKFYHVEENATFESVRRPLFDFIPTLYIYADVVEYQYVGHSKVPLLGVVPVEYDRTREIQRYVFNPITYLPVSQGVLDTVEVQINTSTGEPAPFHWGYVSCTLSFQRSR